MNMSNSDFSIEIPTNSDKETIDDRLDCVLTGKGRVVPFDERLTNRSPPIDSYETVRFGNVGYTGKTPVIGNVDMTWIPNKPINMDEIGKTSGRWVGITHGHGMPTGPFKLGKEHAKLIAEAYDSSVPLGEVLQTPPSKLYIPTPNSHVEIALGRRNPVSVCTDILDWDTILFLKRGNREMILGQLDEDGLKEADKQLAHLKMAICYYLGDKEATNSVHTLAGSLSDTTGVDGYFVGACAADALCMIGSAKDLNSLWEMVIKSKEDGGWGYHSITKLENHPNEGAVLPELVETKCYLRLVERTNEQRYQELIGKFRKTTRAIQRKGHKLWAPFAFLLEQYCSETKYDDVGRRRNLAKIHAVLEANIHNDEDLGISNQRIYVPKKLPLTYTLKRGSEMIVTAEITEQATGPVLDVYVGNKA